MANGQIMQELKEIKIDLNFIKEHMVDVDTILTPEEEIELNESLEELKKGETFSLNVIKKDRKNV
jgi:hypothetical protein